MLSTTLTEFRKEIKKYLDMVTGDVETLIINRGKDRAVVVISMDEYNSLQAVKAREEKLQALSSAAESLAGEYVENRELTEFTSLDFEDFYETR